MGDQKQHVKVELSPEGRRGCNTLLVLAVLVVAAILYYVQDGRKARDCEARACPEGRAARLIDDHCICVVPARE